MRTTIFIYLFLILCLLSRIVFSCAKDEARFEGTGGTSITLDDTRSQDSSILNEEYRQKYYADKYKNIPGLRLANTNDPLLMDLVESYENTSLEQRKYYYYLLSQEKDFPRLSARQKKDLKLFMDSLLVLELEAVNFYNNSVKINNRLVRKDKKELYVPFVKIKSEKVNSILNQKPVLDNYIAQRNTPKEIESRINEIDNIFEINLPVLQQRVKSIKYKLNNYLYKADEVVLENTRIVAEARKEKKIDNPRFGESVLRTDPLLYNYLKDYSPGKQLPDTTPLLSPVSPSPELFPNGRFVAPYDTNIIIFIIIGEDDRTEPYAVDVQEPIYQKATGQAMAIIHKDHLQKINDSSFYFRGYENLELKNVNIEGDYFPLCDNTRFEEQPVIAFCTGFAINDSMLATANHCVSFTDGRSYKDYYWVFDYKMDSNAIFMDTISAALVYEAVKLVKNSYFYENDFALLRADRRIPKNRVIQDFEYSDSFEIGDSVFMVGYPLGLPMKITPQGSITDLLDYEGGYSPFFYCSLDAFEGNSGSPVFLKKNGKCVGFLSNGLKDFEQLSSFTESGAAEECAQEFVMPFEYDRIEELVQKIEDIYLQTTIEL